MKKILFTLLLGGLFLVDTSAQVTFQNHSVTPTLLNLNSVDFPGVNAYSLFGSRDTIQSIPTYRYGGSSDGSGLLKNTNGTYTLLVNHEDNFAVGRLILDSNFEVIDADYILNSNAGMWRLCSATMATPSLNGFGPLFLTCGESSTESMTHAINPNGSSITDSTVSAITTLTGFGKWSAENAVPLTIDAFPGQTIIILGDDDSGPNGGQVVMYVGNGIGDLNNGRLYVLRRTDLDQRERNIPMGSTVNIEFVEIPNYLSMTGAQLNTYSDATLKSIKFNRVEDIDYRKGSPEANREIYFNATGINNSDTVDRTCWGRVYRLKLNETNHLTGTLELIINGDDKSPSNPYRELYQPDNICVTEDYVYVQEDPNGYTFPGSAPYVHDARIYQYDIATTDFTELMEIDHHRHTSDSVTYNRNTAGTAYANSGIGSWEFGAMIDISAQTGVNDAFLLCLQPHTWRFPEFSGVDGGTLRPTEKQGSQLITLTGIPRVKIGAPTVNTVTVCQGEQADLIASGGTTYYLTNGTTYKWYTVSSGGTSFYTGANYQTVALNNDTTFYVSTFANGQESTTRTALAINVNATPATPTINVAGTVLTSSAITGNQWFRNGSIIAGATSQTYTVIQDGFYTVQVTSYGCTSDMSAEQFVLFSLSNEEQVDLENVKVFPNPNDGVFTLSINTGEVSQKLLVQVIDMNGKVVYEWKQDHFNGNLNQQIVLSGQPAGHYLVNIATDTKAYQRKIVQQ